MDLIYTDVNREDVGVLLNYELDLSFGANENDFELKVSSQDHCCEAGCYIYAYGTEYGGIIDAVTSDTESEDVTYSGRTWHGILNSKVLEPDPGEDYLTVSGEANTVLASLVARIGLDSLFTASTENSGITLPTYAMNRYISAYDGIRKMLKSVNAKLQMTYKDDVIVLSVAPVVDYTQDGIDSDFVDFEAKQAKGKVNHLVCLGSGELKDRTVLHLYADEEGNISHTQSLFGIDEYTSVFEYSNVEDDSELEKSGIERLKELRQQDALSVTINDTDNLYDIGDIVGAYDNVTGLSVSVAIEQKIVTIREGLAEVSYSTDRQSTSVSAGSSSGESETGGGAAIAELNKHINDTNNPHNVTAEQVGALNANAQATDSAKLGGKAPEYYIQPRNLLDNSDFTNPVNQRGATTVTAWAYCIDRWLTSFAGSLSFGDNGITTVFSSGSTVRLYQKIANYKRLLGKTVTCAAKINGVVYCASGILPTSYSTSHNIFINQTSDTGVQVAVGNNANDETLIFYVGANTTVDVTLEWAALYEGSYTADTLPEYAQNGYAAELMECMRYYRQGAMPFVANNTRYLGGPFMIIPPMRVTPTATITSNTVSCAGVGSLTLTSPTIIAYAPYVQEIGNSEAIFTTGRVYRVYVALSADL